MNTKSINAIAINQSRGSLVYGFLSEEDILLVFLNRVINTFNVFQKRCQILISFSERAMELLARPLPKKLFYNSQKKMKSVNNPNHEQPNNPLHGVKLADILERLVAAYGWEELGRRIDIRCFKYDPSIKSSLAFLRKTPWARAKVEQLYLELEQ